MDSERSASPDKGYTKGHLLVDAAWVAEHTDDPGVRIVDVRPVDEKLPIGYPWGHIGQAVHLDLHKITTTIEGVRGLLAPQREIEAALGRLGIEREMTIVVYDEGSGLLASRLFWILDYYGHRDVHILDGGMRGWLQEGNKTMTRAPQFLPTEYVALADPSKIATADLILANLGNPQVVLLDTRSPQEYSKGHLPGAVNIPWDMSVTFDGSRTFRAAGEVEGILKAAGATRDKEIICYCESGVRSALLYLLLRLLGYPRVRNYDGSWEEWSKGQGLPIER